MSRRCLRPAPIPGAHACWRQCLAAGDAGRSNGGRGALARRRGSGEPKRGRGVRGGLFPCRRAEARRIQARHPDLPGSLPEDRLRLLPDAVAWGSPTGRVMVELGWPIAARGGDWDATALNHAVFRGDADLTAFLLSHGASWRETQGFGAMCSVRCRGPRSTSQQGSKTPTGSVVPARLWLMDSPAPNVTRPIRTRC